jgi:predicted DNA-binding ArsR family transcriptional regulator
MTGLVVGGQAADQPASWRADPTTGRPEDKYHVNYTNCNYPMIEEAS